MASRLGYDLTTKQGWRNLKYRQWDYKTIFIDTFAKFYCKIFGHIEYDADGQKACKRCCHYI